MRIKAVSSCWSLAIMIPPNNLDDPAAAAFAATLPIFYYGLRPADRTEPASPEHARSKLGIRFQVLKGR